MYEKLEKEKRFKVLIDSQDVNRIKEICNDGLVLQIMDQIEHELKSFHRLHVEFMTLVAINLLIYAFSKIQPFLFLAIAVLIMEMVLLSRYSYRLLTTSEISYINNKLLSYPVKTENVELHTDKETIYIVADKEIHQIFYNPEDDFLKVVTVIQLVEKKRGLYFLENVNLYGPDIQKKDE